jgi:hypothetical protein
MRILIFIGLKALEGIGVCVAVLIVYGLGWVFQKLPFDFVPHAPMFMGGLLMLAVAIIVALFGYLIKLFIDLNREWADNIYCKHVYYCPGCGEVCRVWKFKIGNHKNCF